MLKKLACLFLIVLMSIESFAAVVSDNDGAAFVSKAEFDSLRNTFQAQVNSFNTKIDDKIDQVINDYMSGVRSKLSTRPIILFSKLKEERRTFTNSWTNPTTSTQDDIYLQISKNIIAIYSRGSIRYDVASRYPMLAFYSSNTLSGSHAKWRQPVNNGKSGKYIITKKFEKDGSYIGEYIEDVGLWQVGEYIEMSGGSASDSQEQGWNYFKYSYDPSLDFSSKTTDSIWTRDFVVAKKYKVITNTNGAPDTTGWAGTPMGGALIPSASSILEQADVTVNGFVSITVQESNTGNQNFFNTMSSGAVWTTNTGTINDDKVHNWTYKYEDIKLKGAGAQSYGDVWYWNPNATNPTTGAATGWRASLGVNSANNYNTEFEPLTFMGPEVKMIKGTDFIVKDVSEAAGTTLHYYSGLPLFRLTYKGNLKFNANLKFKNTGATVVAVRDEPFDNTSINSRSTKDIFWKKYTVSEVSTGKVEVEIPANDLRNSVGKILYIKLSNTNTTSGSEVTLSVSDCVLNEV